MQPQVNKNNYNTAPKNENENTNVGGDAAVGNYSNYQWVPRRASPNPSTNNANSGAPQPMHIPSRPNSTGAAHPAGHHHRNGMA
jgi:hypothetical protein